MATPTVNRAEALVRRIARLDAEPARREAVALGLVDALLERDDETLAAALDALRDARAADGDQELVGWLDAAIAFAHWGLERVPSQAAVAQGTQAHDFLSVLDGSPQLGSAELRRLLEIDETQVSRTGRRLLESGLVTRRKVGRQVFWQLTPRGQRALEERPRSDRPTRSSGRRRSGAASRPRTATSPASPARSTPPASGSSSARSSCTPARASRPPRGRRSPRSRACRWRPWRRCSPRRTTWPEAAAGTSWRACSCRRTTGRREVFAGASSEHERIHRLVETFFGAYERGADGITAARRERKDVPAVDESMQELDNTFDALVVEALRPRRDGRRVPEGAHRPRGVA